MVSPARASFLKKSAALAAKAAAERQADPFADAASPYEVLRAALGAALVDLKNIQSIEAKIERKREILPDFLPWCDGVLEGAGEAGPDYHATADDIVAQVLVWTLDVGDFAKALELGGYVIRHGLELPERFKRTAGTMIVDVVAETALKAAGQGETFPLDVLLQTDELTGDEDMPDQARAKLKKAIGLELARQAAELPEEGADGAAGGKRAAIAAALDALRRALALNSSVGVKKDIERLEREAKRLAPAA